MKTKTVPIDSVKVGDFMFVNGNRIEVKKITKPKSSRSYVNDQGKFEKGTIVLRGTDKDDDVWYAGPNGTALIQK